MRVTQDLNSFGEIIAHAQCSVDEYIYIYIYIKSKGIYQSENLMSNGSSRHDDAAQTIYSYV